MVKLRRYIKQRIPGHHAIVVDRDTFIANMVRRSNRKIKKSRRRKKEKAAPSTQKRQTETETETVWGVESALSVLLQLHDTLGQQLVKDIYDDR